MFEATPYHCILLQIDELITVHSRPQSLRFFWSRTGDEQNNHPRPQCYSRMSIYFLSNLEGIARIAMDKNVDDVSPTSSTFREDNGAGIE